MSWSRIVRFGVVASLVIISFALVACENVANGDTGVESASENASEDTYPRMRVLNNYENRAIISVSLVGYSFGSLSIETGESQTFHLWGGMPGGYENINVIVSYRGGVTRQTSNKFDFEDGQITEMTLTSEGKLIH
jgi:hypothetical protein